jgi:ABC-type multidrug transport system fused ATPase/permease subunit
VVKAFAGDARESATLSRLQEAYRGAVMRATRTTAAYVPGLMLAISALVVLAVATGSERVATGAMTAGALLESIWILGMALGPIEGLGGLYNECLVAGAAAERIFLLLDTTPEVKDAPGAVDPGRLAGDVEFRDVSFAYDPAVPAPPQVHGVSFRVKAGERIALVGPTGAGKTSILNLLARFYEPQSGTILLDGRDARTVRGDALHRQMGIVLQENYGANLSEGERQIVCFVRAHLADPSILILDEATSAVDTRTEAMLLRALRALSSRRTTFVIAHRLSTIRDADRILVLQGGRVVEQGRHAELLARDGSYARLYAEYAR